MSKRDKDSISSVLIVAVAVCLVCSVLVSTAAVILKPAQIANKELDLKQNILRAAGLLPEGAKVDEKGRDANELFKQFNVKLVDLERGEYTDAISVADYDQLRAAKDPALSRSLTGEEDIATLKRLERYGLVYLLEEHNQIHTLVIPVRGYGLWGTLYGYLALDGDMQTVSGLGFYSHKETPGLGGEVDNPKWKALWPGVKVFDAEGQPVVNLVKRRSAAGSSAASHEVDALSGATMTSRGIKNLINFWTGELGYGPFLHNLSEAANQRSGSV